MAEYKTPKPFYEPTMTFGEAKRLIRNYRNNNPEYYQQARKIYKESKRRIMELEDSKKNHVDVLDDLLGDNK